MWLHKGNELENPDDPEGPCGPWVRFVAISEDGSEIIIANTEQICLFS